MPALDDWFPGSSVPDHRRADTRSGRVRPLKRPPHRLRAALLLAGGAVIAAPIIAALAVPAVAGVGIAGRQVATWWNDMPVQLPPEAPLPQRSFIYASDGKTLIASYYAENRSPVPLRSIPPQLVQAVLAIEDDRFYQHGPVDVRGTARAVLHNLTGGYRQGGSGITQQYVKNLLLTEARTDAQRKEVTATTLDRKLKEARLSVEVEQKLGKDGVLAAYLNTVYFGRGAYGVAAASERFFGVRMSQLTLPQAATLAGMLKSPTHYDPISNPKLSTIRRNAVLTRMAATGVITAAEAKAAQGVKLQTALTPPPGGCGTSHWPFYCQLVLDTLANDPAFGATREARADLIFRGGLKVVTAMDPAAMRVAQKAVDAGLSATNRVATAMAVVQPGTGHVLAISTNRRWGSDVARGQTEIVLPAVPRFQPGSTFKPITLAAALEQGFSPYAKLDTPNGYVPAALNSPEGGFHNDDDQGHGYLDAFGATAESVNTYYVQLIERTGVLRVADMAGRLGMTSLPREGRSAVGSKDAALTLGAFETSPVQMANVYATLAARGTACPAVVVVSVKRRDGGAAPQPNTTCRQLLSPAVADMVTSVLQGVFSEAGTGAGLGLTDRPAAGKTGTTNNHGATWFAGYVPQYAAAVWVGDPRGPQFALQNVEAFGQTFDTVYGRSIAGPEWRQAMTALTSGLPVQQFVPADPSALIGASPSVPDVRGMSRDGAITVLVRGGYAVRVSAKTAPADPLVQPGTVMAQSPAPGTPAGLESAVTLVLSAGSATSVRVPGQSP